MNVETIAIETLVNDPANARKHSEKNLDAIKGSLARFGQQKPIVVDLNGVVIAGNGTLMAAKQLGWSEIETVKSELAGSDKTAFAIADNRTAELAEWDGEILEQQLKALHEEHYDLDAVGFDAKEFDFDDSLTDDDDPYTKKVMSPIYEPTGDKPKLSELFNKEKTESLVKEINALDISSEEKAFLIQAASRHTVFNYEKIAEYYAHSDADVQNLMENSALVIIDFNKAIENGFVKLTDDIAEAYNNEVE